MGPGTMSAPSKNEPVALRALLAVAVVLWGCTGSSSVSSSGSLDTDARPASSAGAAPGSIPPAAGGQPSSGTPTEGGVSSDAGAPLDASSPEPIDEPPDAGVPLDASTAEPIDEPPDAEAPVDSSSAEPIDEPPDSAAPVDASIPESGTDADAPVEEPPDAAVVPDVPDPVFEGPWFPCPEEDYPEHTVVVRTHDKVVHTSSSTEIDAEIELPEGSFKAIALRVEHECPTGGICDLYDRRAVFELVSPGEENIELMRYVTTYRFQPGQTNYMCSWTDVTAYASLLTGTRTLRSYLDTVVSPGDELGDGWQVSAELVFYPGPAADPVQIKELYGGFINIGEAPGSIDEQTPPTTVEIPLNVTEVVAQLTVTGHGWGPENTDNCAEFCRLDQTISVNGGPPHVINPFRDDCASNPLAALQQRNPTGSRNGWCPGAVVVPHRVDITDEVTPGMPAEIDFGVQRADGSEYIDADPTGYNPNEMVSLQLFMSTDGVP